MSKDLGFPERGESRAGEDGPVPGESRCKGQKKLHLEIATKPRGGCLPPFRGRAGALSLRSFGNDQGGTQRSCEGGASAGAGTHPGNWWLEAEKAPATLLLFFQWGKKKKLSVSVTDLRSGCLLLESQYSRDKYRYKGKFALFRRPATWEEGGLMSKGQRPTAGHREELKRGHFGDAQEEGGFMPCSTVGS